MITHEAHVGWILRSHRGKILGIHPTEKKAIAQERAINISKARAAGYRIPRKPKRRH